MLRLWDQPVVIGMLLDGPTLGSAGSDWDAVQMLRLQEQPAVIGMLLDAPTLGSAGSDWDAVQMRP